MPTTKARHALTETKEISEALVDAATRWPGEAPTALLKHLVALGHAALLISLDAERAAVRETSGALTGIYQRGDLEELRADWPA